MGEPEEGAYRIQALFDFDVYHSNHANGEGNLYSEVQEVNWTGDNVLEFELIKLLKAMPFKQTEYLNQVAFIALAFRPLRSRNCSESCGRSARSYFESPELRYPVIYTVSGFGGLHETMGLRLAMGGFEPEAGEVEFIRVFLMDSANGDIMFVQIAKMVLVEPL